MASLAELQWATVQGREVAYRAAGTGPTLVLVHAFPYDQRMWAPQHALAEHCHLVTYDVRGFGASALSEPGFSLDDLADDLHGLMGVLGCETFVLGGLSMGGYIALAYQRRHGRHLRGLALADTRAGADAPAARERRLAMAARLGELPPPRVSELAPPAALLSPTAPPALAAELTAWVDGANPFAVAAAQQAMAARPDATAQLAGIEVPGLVLVGEDDALTPVSEAEILASGMPNSTLVRLPKAGHLSNMEAPAAFNAALLGLLDRARA